MKKLKLSNKILKESQDLNNKKAKETKKEKVLKRKK